MVRPNVLRNCAVPNTLGGMTHVVPPGTGRPAGRLLLAGTFAGLGAAAVLAWLGR